MERSRMNEPVLLRPLSPENAALFREIRLEGLAQDPDAFTSTFEDESAKKLSYFAESLAASTVFAAFRGPDLLGGCRVLCPARSKASAQGDAVGHVCQA